MNETGSRMRFERHHGMRTGTDGFIAALSPLPLIIAHAGTAALPSVWRLAVAGAASLAWLSCSVVLLRRPLLGRPLGLAAAGATYAAAFPWIRSDPFAALLFTVTLIWIGFALWDFRIPEKSLEKEFMAEMDRLKIVSAVCAVPVAVIAQKLVDSHTSLTLGAVAASSMVAIGLCLNWAANRKAWPLVLLTSVCLAAWPAADLLGLFYHAPSLALTVSLILFLAFPGAAPESARRRQHWWALLLNHPARVLLTTFLVLSLVGTGFLLVPAATTARSISVVDAAFTSVSAVCVTGLVVLDTPHDFTALGQGIILVLIQLGGLGIMSIATIAMHALGRRISLRQERMMTAITDSGHADLIASIIRVLTYTLVAEGAGTLILWFLFVQAGDPWPTALWRGVFTSISAFCNAGFALQTDSLIPFQQAPLVLHTVGLLIIFGGMAPATGLAVSRWLSGKPVPVPARIALVATAVLLVSGLFFFLTLEWEGILKGLPPVDKIHNAWFQSVTLRTAGFNSVDISSVRSPTFLIMLCQMFIGGSPGGTAGGVKTVTLGLLAVTFWANITNRSALVIQNRRLQVRTVYRAVTIVVSGIIVWFLAVLMLEVTQQLPARDVIFEATSALGTVGLTCGITPLFDPIGKVVVMLTMFAGRIGPMTLFMLLSDEQVSSVPRCPDVKISLT